jgi:predicted transcriptional regulator of viral defense system
MPRLQLQRTIRDESIITLANTYRRRLHERALDQYGFVTTRDAKELGVPAIELVKLSRRGGISRVSHGLYRFDDVPPSQYDQAMEAVLAVGPNAYLSHDAVLAMHDLALASPLRFRVGTPDRIRRHVPATIEAFQRHLDATERTVYEGIPSTTVARALIDARGLIMDVRLAEATREAEHRGLIRKVEAERILAELDAA